MVHELWNIMMLALREHILKIRLGDFRLSAGEMQIELNAADR